MNLLRFVIGFVTVVSLLCTCYCKNLYQVLGISELATENEIKSAYKRLAKRWHPDKNSSPEANERFIQITEAYEVLSDKKRRYNYDLGETQDNRFSMFHNNFFFTGHRGNTINIQQYKDHIIPESWHKPFLLYFYHDFCLRCVQVSSIWDQLKKELVRLKVGMVTINIGMAVSLAHHVGVTYAPAIVAVNDGRSYYFTGTFSLSGIKKFLRSVLPSVIVLTDVPSFQQFVSKAIYRNRPRVIVCSSYSSPSLHVLLNAKKHRRFIDFGYVSVSDDSNDALSSLLGLSSHTAILVFKEQSNPVFNMKSSSIAADTLWGVALDNRLLILPRLTSQEHFSLLCPMITTRERCVLLVVPDNKEYNNSAVVALRQLAVVSENDSIHFGIVDASKQREFLSNFDPIPAVSCTPYHPVLIMQYHRGNHVNYEWQYSWCGDSKLFMISVLSDDLTHTANLEQHLVDEETPGLLETLYSKWSQTWDDVLIFLSLLEIDAIIPLISITVGVLMIAILSFITQQNISLPLESDQRPIHQFTASLYQERVVGNIANNHVLVVLIQVRGSDNKELLLTYKEVAKHYRSTSKESLLFSYSIGRSCHYEWYRRLIIEANVKDMLEALNENDVIAVALYSKKKALCLAHFTIQSVMENLLNFDAVSPKTLRDQMMMWIDRILDGTAEKKYLDTWPSLGYDYS